MLIALFRMCHSDCIFLVFVVVRLSCHLFAAIFSPDRPTCEWIISSNILWIFDVIARQMANTVDGQSIDIHRSARNWAVWCGRTRPSATRIAQLPSAMEMRNEREICAVAGTLQLNTNISSNELLEWHRCRCGLCEIWAKNRRICMRSRSKRTKNKTWNIRICWGTRAHIIIRNVRICSIFEEVAVQSHTNIIGHWNCLQFIQSIARSLRLKAAMCVRVMNIDKTGINWFDFSFVRLTASTIVDVIHQHVYTYMYISLAFERIRFIYSNKLE